MKRRDRIAMWIAWRLPAVVVLWAATRLMAFATQGKYGSTNVPTLTAMEALNRWIQEYGG
jgi:hypothetical protein